VLADYPNVGNSNLQFNYSGVGGDDCSGVMRGQILRENFGNSLTSELLTNRGILQQSAEKRQEQLARWCVYYLHVNLL
jgi:hypothetical protein